MEIPITVPVWPVETVKPARWATPPAPLDTSMVPIPSAGARLASHTIQKHRNHCTSRAQLSRLPQGISSREPYVNWKPAILVSVWM
eukprot:scaffold1182_cov396-Prasinococcus_capsulatus_cf.AAC.23